MNWSGEEGGKNIQSLIETKEIEDPTPPKVVL